MELIFEEDEPKVTPLEIADHVRAADVDAKTARRDIFNILSMFLILNTIKTLFIK